jgi:hypothetical protein
MEQEEGIDGHRVLLRPQSQCGVTLKLSQQLKAALVAAQAAGTPISFRLQQSPRDGVTVRGPTGSS